MKKQLLLENQEIIKEFSDIFKCLKAQKHKNLVQFCLTKFCSLTDQWTDFSKDSEKELQSTTESSRKSLRSIKSYRKSIEDNSNKLEKATSKEQLVMLKQKEIVSHLSIFPQLWKKNLHKLKQKSLSWRMTPFVQQQYDQEFSFINTKKIDKALEENISLEYEKVMQEIEANRSEYCYEADRISIEKSFGGWKSEYDSEVHSEIVDINEIKNAISVLSKVNLLKPESRNLLSKITDAIKNREDPNKLALYLQLASLNITEKLDFSEMSSHDVNPEELLEATSLLSEIGPKLIEGSLEISFEDYGVHKKTMSLGKNSTKDMTEKLKN